MNLKKIFAAAALGFALSPAIAQDKAGPHVGLVTGVNSTWLFDKKLWDDPNYDSRNTWNTAPIGLVLGYKINPGSSFQVEITKTNMGAEYDIKGRETLTGEPKTVGEKRIETTYWSIPVLYKFTSGDNIRFSFQVGPQFSFLSDGTEVNELTQTAYLKVGLQSTDLPGTVSTNDQNFPAGKTEIAAKNDFRKTDVGAVLGLGLEADITNNLYISGNARLYYGLSDIRSEERVKYYEERNNHATRNNVTGGFQLGLHYRFDLR